MAGVYRSPDFEYVASTVENLLAGRCKPVFSIETITAIYQAHTLDEAMSMWRWSPDKSPVIAINCAG